MKLEYRLLTDEELGSGLKELHGWQVVEGQLTRTFEFKAYQEGLVFATAVGLIADRLDHHPDLHIGYKKVEVRVNTHSVNGLSPYDLELARRIDELIDGQAISG